MEERYKQIVAFIERLAASNPYITREQIAKAKSMYNGDDRPIEIIQAELEAYSAQIEAQGKKSENDKIVETPKEVKSSLKSPQISGNNPSVTGFVLPEIEANITEIRGPRLKDIPTMEEGIEESQNEMNYMFADASMENSENKEIEKSSISNQKNYGEENQKVLVKTPSQNISVETPSTGDDGGYGNLEAILSLTIIFSIVTIIMGLFTIILK